MSAEQKHHPVAIGASLAFAAAVLGVCVWITLEEAPQREARRDLRDAQERLVVAQERYDAAVDAEARERKREISEARQ